MYTHHKISANKLLFDAMNIIGKDLNKSVLKNSTEKLNWIMKTNKYLRNHYKIK
jgi:hypothetical protein